MKNTTQIILILSIIITFMLGMITGIYCAQQKYEKIELEISAKKNKTDENTNRNSNKHNP